MNKKNPPQKDEVKIGATTGSLATASALSSLLKITTNKDIDAVEIQTPTKKLNINIKNIKQINKNKAESTCIKYPYSDPDVTVGLEIKATVELKNKNKNNQNKNKQNDQNKNNNNYN